MKISTTLYRFRLDLSDVERGVYEQLDLRLAMHPSESIPYLLTRVLAFALNAQEGLEFSPTGLCDPEGPAIFKSGGDGRVELWIEIGNPSPKKLHKASKACARVAVYTYKDAEALLREAAGEAIHRAEYIQIFAIDAALLVALAPDLRRDMRWQILHHDGVLSVTTPSQTAQSEIKKFSLA